ncbi:hypothetical protein F3Y22_tig00111852pilonHSYRG00008 [Hibiscus syriacus]|uniref:GH3 auxin-responsive promoter n=1 Tax=Hibiscus syriacus TaxID=106335 RepID=A0A6A2XY55_HIBSY|nr:hypothetical protein F3Y22_tig00111852pilonHSYRG00008 [Hibiscus syriacus]
METNDYESGLRMLEELSTNARRIQGQLLGEILTKNAGTEYLSRFLHGQNDKRLFRKNVPVVAYEDLKPYIDRIANGEASSDILLAHPLTGSGTSGGQQNLIPVVDETTDTLAM